MSGLRMHTERTPNPESVKWVLGRTLLETDGFVPFDEPVPASVSPLGARLLAIEGVERLLLGRDFLTVTKQRDAGWRELGLAITAAIRDWDAAAEPALGEAFAAPTAAEDDEVVARIRQILQDEIGPFVAQDGGEITLEDYAQGVVRVRLRGACDGCPSSSVTLKMGIEARLREQIPEVQSVVAVE